MTDLTKITDQELDSLIAKESASQKGPDLKSMTDEDLDKLIASEVSGPSFSDKALDAVSKVGKFVDSYTGAPARAALSELTRTTPEFGKDRPSILGNIGAAASAYAEQFGADPALAPTGSEIAEKRFGISGERKMGTFKPTPDQERLGMKPITRPVASSADVAGFGIDVLADPTNVIPVGTVVKAAGKGAQFGLKAGKAAAEAVPGVKAGKEAAERIINDFVRPKRAPEFSELAKIADKHAIDLTKAPESVEFGKSSVISRLGRSQAEGPAGQAKLEAHRAYLGDVSQAFNRELSQEAPIMGRVDAGLNLRNAYNKSVSKMFDEADTGYSYFVENYPGLKISKEASQEVASKINGIEKFAKGRISRGLSPAQVAQGRMLLNATSAIRRTNGSFKQMVEALRDLGEIAYQKTIIGQIPPDVAKTRELYRTLRESLIKTIETEVKDGPAMAGALKISNEKISKFLKDSEFIDDVLSNADLAPEQVFDRISKNTSQIDALRATLSPEDFDAFRASYIDSLVKRGDDGVIRFPTLKNTLENKQNKEVIKKLYASEPEKLKDLLDVVRLGEAAGVDVLSTSGTGAAFKFGNLKDGITNAITNEATLESLKQSARNRSLRLPPEARAAQPRNPFGPGAISLPEAVGLRLPQQISIQQRNRERNP